MYTVGASRRGADCEGEMYSMIGNAYASDIKARFVLFMQKKWTPLIYLLDTMYVLLKKCFLFKD